MASLRFSWICCVYFGLLALGSANELESFLGHEALPVSKNELYRELHFNINRLLDNNIGHIQYLLRPFDPVGIRDIPISNKGQLTNGLLSEVSKIKRTGDSSIDYGKKVLSLQLTFGWELLKFDFDYEYKLMLVPRRGKLHGSVEKLSINLKVSVDFRNSAVVLENLEIIEMGKINVELEGTFGDSIRAIIGENIVNLIKNRIKHTVEKIASEAIQEKLDELNKNKPIGNHTFTFIDLVELRRNEYENEDDI